MYRLLVLLLFLSCEKWPHEVDCYCVLDGGLVRNTWEDTFISDCEESGGFIVQCEIHDIIKYNERSKD